MKWIEINESTVQPFTGIEYLVWVNDGEEGYALLAELRVSPLGKLIWNETAEGLGLQNVTHFAYIKRP